MKFFIFLTFDEWFDIERKGYVEKNTPCYKDINPSLFTKDIILRIEIDNSGVYFSKKTGKYHLKEDYFLDFSKKDYFEKDKLLIPVLTYEGKKLVHLEDFIGFEYNGWWDFLKKSIKEILRLVKKANLENKFCFLQIEKRFGKLKIITNDYTNEEIDLFINEIEERSLRICYKCGSPGFLRDLNGDFYVFCEECYKEELKNKYNEKVLL